MPRYFFHINHIEDFTDVVGVDLLDVGEAKRQAVRAAGEHLVDTSLDLWGGPTWSIAVEDSLGNSIFGLKVAATEAVI